MCTSNQRKQAGSWMGSGLALLIGLIGFGTGSVWGQSSSDSSPSRRQLIQALVKARSASEREAILAQMKSMNATEEGKKPTEAEKRKSMERPVTGPESPVKGVEDGPIELEYPKFLESKLPDIKLLKESDFPRYEFKPINLKPIHLKPIKLKPTEYKPVEFKPLEFKRPELPGPL